MARKVIIVDGIELEEYDGTLFAYVGFIALVVFFISIGIYSFDASKHDDEYAFLKPIIDEVRPALVPGKPESLIVPLYEPYLIVYLGDGGPSRFTDAAENRHGFLNPIVFDHENVEDLKTLILVKDRVTSSGAFTSHRTYRAAGGLINETHSSKPGAVTLYKYSYGVWAVDIATRKVAIHGTLSDKSLRVSYSSGDNASEDNVSIGEIITWAECVIYGPHPSRWNIRCD